MYAEMTFNFFTSRHKLLFAIGVFISILPVMAQTKYTQKLFAYRQTARRTNIFINDTTYVDTAAHSTYLIFIELPRRDTPIWNAATIDGSFYAVHSTLVENIPLTIGERKADKRLVQIKPQPANRLWKLNFILSDEKVSATRDTSSGVILKGIFKNKKVTSTITGVVDLEAQK